MTDPPDPYAVPSGYLPPVSAAPVGYGPPPSGYAQPYPQPYAQPPQSKTSVLAILAVVAVFVFAPAGLVLGVVARKEIAKTGQGGSWMAWVGIMVGAIGTLMYLAALVFLVALLGGFEWLQ